MTAAKDVQRRPPSALRNRNFALLWAGQTTSVIGNGIYTVALPLEVLRINGSPVDLAIVVSSRVIPTVLLLLVGGSIVDRLSRRLVMLTSDTVSGLSVSAMAVLVALGEKELWEFILLSVIFGIASAFFMPASTVIARDILPSELLVSGSSLTSLSQSLGQYLTGPLAGGIIVAILGGAWAFGIDGMTFAVSACCLANMRDINWVKRAESKVTTGIKEGLLYCRSQPWLWWSLIGVGIANLVAFVPLNSVLQPLLVRHVFRAGPELLGIMYAANGAGGALASLCAKRWGSPRRRVVTILGSWTGAGLAAMLIGLSPWAWLATFFMGAMWFGITYGNVLWFPLMQAEVPRDLLGRVSSVDWLLSLALSPLGTIVGGFAAEGVGVRLTAVIGGTLAMVATGGAMASPRVRQLDRRSPAPPESVTVPDNQ